MKVKSVFAFVMMALKNVIGNLTDFILSSKIIGEFRYAFRGT